MKHVKLFEEWTGKRRLPTLGDIIHPDNLANFNGDEVEWIEEAVERTANVFSIKSTITGDESAKLNRLGLMTDASKRKVRLERMDLDQIVMVYGFSEKEQSIDLGLQHLLVKTYPNLFRNDSSYFNHMHIRWGTDHNEQFSFDEPREKAGIKDPNVPREVFACQDVEPPFKICMCWEYPGWTQIWMRMRDIPG